LDLFIWVMIKHAVYITGMGQIKIAMDDGGVRTFTKRKMVL